MRGKVLGFDNNTGKGVISSDDGSRYDLTGSSLGAGVKILIPGQEVDFVVKEDGETRFASEIYPVKGAASGSSVGGEKSKVAAGILALLLGHWGIHKFYLGKTTAGVIQLLLGIFGWLLILPGIANLIIAFIEGIIYLTKSDEAFYEQYVVGDKSWF